MTKTTLPTNFVKHTSKNPIQKLLIKNFFSNLILLSKPLNAESILDAGCGEGFTMNKLLEEKISKSIEGIEYAEEVIAIAKKSYPHLNIKKASIYDLPYKNKTFDLVICTEVLEHLEDPIKAIKEMVRVSRKYLIISAPNEPYFMLGNFLRGKNILRFGNDIGHINHWSSSSLEKLLIKNGLKIKKIVLPFPWTIILATK